jgi:rRNA maturation endonuclease Nob1
MLDKPSSLKGSIIPYQIGMYYVFQLRKSNCFLSFVVTTSDSAHVCPSCGWRKGKQFESHPHGMKETQDIRTLQRNFGEKQL